MFFEIFVGGIPKWSNGSDCKSDGYAFEGSNPSPTTKKSSSLIWKMKSAMYIKCCKWEWCSLKIWRFCGLKKYSYSGQVAHSTYYYDAKRIHCARWHTRFLRGYLWIMRSMRMLPKIVTSYDIYSLRFRLLLMTKVDDLFAVSRLKPRPTPQNL